jgi:hypothetical protein
MVETQVIFRLDKRLLKEFDNTVNNSKLERKNIPCKRESKTNQLLYRLKNGRIEIWKR